MILENQLALTKEVAEVKGQVVEVNHTIHNGMSRAIHETVQRVTTIESDLDEARPFYASMTVDEMSKKYIQYIGDDNEIALSCLTGKAEAKTYIRSLFGGQP